jgi:hypothetical protein
LEAKQFSQIPGSNLNIAITFPFAEEFQKGMVVMVAVVVVMVAVVVVMVVAGPPTLLLCV